MIKIRWKQILPPINEVILSWFISLHFDNWYISLTINTKMWFNPVMGNPFAVTILSRYTSTRKMIYNFNLNLSSLLIFYPWFNSNVRMSILLRKWIFPFYFLRTLSFIFSVLVATTEIYYHKLMGYKIRILLFCCHTFILRFV